MDSQQIIEEVVLSLEQYKNGDLKKAQYKRLKNMLFIIGDEIGGKIERQNTIKNRKIYNEIV